MITPIIIVNLIGFTLEGLMAAGILIILFQITQMKQKPGELRSGNRSLKIKDAPASLSSVSARKKDPPEARTDDDAKLKPKPEKLSQPDAGSMPVKVDAVAQLSDDEKEMDRLLNEVTHGETDSPGASKAIVKEKAKANHRMFIPSLPHPSAQADVEVTKETQRSEKTREEQQENAKA
ncbi:unnamed protein product, partial [Mesorhabditis spiculigera]